MHKRDMKNIQVLVHSCSKVQKIWVLVGSSYCGFPETLSKDVTFIL